MLICCCLTNKTEGNGCSCLRKLGDTPADIDGGNCIDFSDSDCLVIGFNVNIPF